jgi:hypothetical protein
MDEQTKIIEKPHDSRILNISLRGWITLIIVTTICLMSLWQIDVNEFLRIYAGMVISYYFAQNQKPKTQQQ